MAVLAISGGYFGYFLFAIPMEFLLLTYYGLYVPLGKNWHGSQFLYWPLSPDFSYVEMCDQVTLTLNDCHVQCEQPKSSRLNGLKKWMLHF